MSKYVIETKNLTKQYGTQKSVANLNIHVRKGRIYGLLGRNSPLPGKLQFGESLWRQMKKSYCPVLAA